MNGLHQPDLKAFVATLDPDPELTALAETFAALDQRLAAARQRGRELVARLHELDSALLEAEGKARTTLLIERNIASADHATLPALLDVLARQHTLAHLAYLRKMATLAREEAQRQQDALESALAHQRGVARQLDRDASGGRIAVPLTADQTAALKAEHREGAEALRPALARRDQALEVAALAGALAALAYGDDHALAATHLWERFATVAGQRQVRQFKASTLVDVAA